MIRCTAHDLELLDADQINQHILDHLTALEHAMTAQQDHLDTVVTAFGAAVTDLTNVVASLKAELTADALDFTAADAAVAAAQAAVTAAQPPATETAPPADPNTPAV